MTTRPPFTVTRQTPDVSVSALREWVKFLIVIGSFLGMLWAALTFSVKYHDRGIEAALQSLSADSQADRCQKAKRASGATFEVAVLECQAENPRGP